MFDKFINLNSIICLGLKVFTKRVTNIDMDCHLRFPIIGQARVCHKKLVRFQVKCNGKNYQFEFKHRHGRYCKVKTGWFQLVRENNLRVWDKITFGIHQTRWGEEEYSITIRRGSPPRPDA